jgi:hypothetical protein
MTREEGVRRVDAAIMEAFARQQDGHRSDFVTVRVDDDPGDPGGFQAFVHAPSPTDHAKARRVVLKALAGERVTFP